MAPMSHGCPPKCTGSTARVRGLSAFSIERASMLNVSVSGSTGTGIAPTWITASQVAGLARDTVTPESDALFIACSQLPTHAIVGALQSELQRPVWSSIQASAWQTQERLS